LNHGFWLDGAPGHQGVEALQSWGNNPVVAPAVKDLLQPLFNPALLGHVQG
jgi:hypothetical protein